jgi:predicted  nucleic acid-binding Zn-ribbon protein
MLSSFSTGWFFVAKERLYSDYMDLRNLFETTVEKLNREIASSNKEKEELKSKLAASEKELNILESRNRDLESKYEALLKDKDDLNKELAMVKKSKFYLEKKIKDVESDIFVAGLLKDKASMEVELKRLKDSLVPKDLKIEELKTENSDLASLLSKLKEEKVFLEQKLKDAEGVSEVLTRDLLREKDKNEKDRQEFESAKVENRLLKAKMLELENVSARLDKLLVEKEDMKMKIASLERDLDYKNQEIDRFKTSFMERETREEYRAEAYQSPQEVELPPIVLEREKYGRDRVTRPSLDWIDIRSDLKGRVVTVNREHNFVVIDLGKQNGLDVGATLNVYRGNLLIGALEVIQARDRIAACDIKEVKDGFFVEIDDVIVKR